MNRTLRNERNLPPVAKVERQFSLHLMLFATLIMVLTSLSPLIIEVFSDSSTTADTGESDIIGSLDETSKSLDTGHQVGSGGEPDLSVGGEHLASGEYWQRGLHNITPNDWDGDGLLNGADSFPTDFSRPAKAHPAQIRCPADSKLPCDDFVGFSMSSAPIVEFEDLSFPFQSSWADVDGDGDQDVTISGAETTGMYLKTYLNENGVISDEEDSSITPPGLIAAYEWADMDSDGDLDLLAGMYPPIDLNTFTIELRNGHNALFLNDGNGLNPSPVWFNNASGIITNAVAWGDVNGDGLLDAAFGNNGWDAEGTIIDTNDQNRTNHIYLNDGNGGLMNNPWWSSTTKYFTIGLELADVDGDGDVDMVVTNNLKRANINFGGFIEYYENDNGFSATPTWTNATSLVVDTRYPAALTDFDADGDIDLAYTNDSGYLIVLEFDAGTYSDVPVMADCIAECNGGSAVVLWGDMDMDGDDDIITMTESGAGSCIYLNLGGLNGMLFTSDGFWCDDSDGQWGSANLGDMDGDGDLDIVRAGKESGKGEILLNSVRTVTTSGEQSGDWELIVGGSSLFIGYEHIDCELSSCSASPETWPIGSNEQIESGTLVDFNSDFAQNVVLSKNNIFFHMNSIRSDEGDMSFDDPEVIDPWRSVSEFTFGDIDNDGDLDIVGAAGGDSLISYIQGTSGWLCSDGGSCEVNSGNDGTNRWSSSFTHQIWNSSVDTQNFEFKSFKLVDVDGDGDLDLSYAMTDHGSGAATTPAVCIHRNLDGLGNFSDEPVWCGLPNTEGRDIAWNDFDGDGDQDIAVATPNAPAIVFVNGGGGTSGFTQVNINHPSCLNLCGLRAVDWVDLDNDGDAELIVAGQMVKIGVFENRNGVLSTNNAYYLQNVPSIQDLTAADIDRNGYLDIIGASREGGTLIHLNHNGRLSGLESWKDTENLGTFETVSAVDWNLDGGINVFLSSHNELQILGTAFDNDGDLVPDDDYDELAQVKNAKADRMPMDPTQWADDDLDGFGEEEEGMLPDSCPNIYGESWRDRWGCTDEDSDGQSNLYDDFWIKDTQWTDTDGDGLGDNYGNPSWAMQRLMHWPGAFTTGAYNPDPFPMDRDNDGFEDSSLFADNATGDFDDCPFTFGKSRFDVFGCSDTDNDGWSDEGDIFAGDMSQWNDSDGDGFGDNRMGFMGDGCENVAGNSTEDMFGCIDMDGDGWSVFTDIDDSNPWEWVDFDGDGFGDNSDRCPYDHGNISGGPDLGCTDLDGDGVADRSDAFVNHPAQWSDTDEDGFGDNQNTPVHDSCPAEAGTSFRLGIRGCPDNDNDGFADDLEDCDDVPGLSSIAMLGCPDMDGDGLPDEVDLYLGPHGGTAIDYDGDGVPNILDDFEYDRTQTVDSDGDGHGDNQSEGATDPDFFTTIDGAWDDSDEDGWTDQLGNDNTDDCPSIPGNSTTPWRGCPDMDGDGEMDITDEDSDGDGITNVLEMQAGGALATPFDIYNASSVPDDLDGDGMPDALDEDSDGDGFPDDLERERGSDPMDADQDPMNLYGDSGTGFYYVPGEGFESGYQQDGIEMSASMLVNLITSEYLFAVLMIPLTMFALLRKKRRYKKLRRKLNDIEFLAELERVEPVLDKYILKGKIRVEHGLLLRNLYERRREEMMEEDDSPSGSGGGGGGDLGYGGGGGGGGDAGYGSGDDYRPAATAAKGRMMAEPAPSRGGNDDYDDEYDDDYDDAPRRGPSGGRGGPSGGRGGPSGGRGGPSGGGGQQGRRRGPPGR